MDNSTKSKSSNKSYSNKNIQHIDSKENLSNLELRTRYEKLKKENSQLNRDIDELKSKGVTADLKPLMGALHEYNEMKDLAQMVLGFLANAENVTIGDLHKKFNLPLD